MSARLLRSRPRHAVGLFALLGALLSVTARADWSALVALERDGARVTAAAFDLSNNTAIQQLNADTRLTPASLTKLTTAAAALQTWPADKMFQTRLVTVATMHDGVLGGDLILRGAGDPSLDDKSLWSLAAQLKGAGVTSVEGRLIVSPAPFGVVACETPDRCKALQRSDTAYNAPLASIGVHFGNWCVVVRPTTPGAAALVRGCGVMNLPMAVDGTIKTVPDGRKQTFWVERLTTDGGDRLRVGGDIPASGGQEVYRAMSDPARGVGLLLMETLGEIGIRVIGPVVVSVEPLPEHAYVLAQTEGLSLRELLGRMLRFSNNYIADVLTLDLAASLLEQPPTQLSAASHLLSDVVVQARRSARMTGAKSAPPLFSGSGLTPENQLSANDLVSLLAYQYRDTRHFPAFYGALVVPRDSPFEFLRRGSREWLDRVALKTGTMDVPYSVCGIAGYLRKRDGGWIAFAVIVNGGPRMRRVPLFKALEAARIDLDKLLQR